jgi:hypothetical protein
MSLLDLLAPFLQQPGVASPAEPGVSPAEPGTSPVEPGRNALVATADKVRQTEAARRKRWQNQCFARLQKNTPTAGTSSSSHEKQETSDSDLSRYLTWEWKKGDNHHHRRPQQRALWSYLFTSCINYHNHIIK